MFTAKASLVLILTASKTLFVVPSWESLRRASTDLARADRAQGIGRRAFEGLFVSKKPDPSLQQEAKTKTSQPQAEKEQTGSAQSGSGFPRQANTGFPGQQASQPRQPGQASAGPPTQHRPSQPTPAASQQPSNGVSSFAALMQRKPPIAGAAPGTPSVTRQTPNGSGFPSHTSAAPTQPRPAPPTRPGTGFPAPGLTGQGQSGFPARNGAQSGFPSQPTAEARTGTGFPTPPVQQRVSQSSFPAQTPPSAPVPAPPPTQPAAKSPAPAPSPRPPPKRAQKTQPHASDGGTAPSQQEATKDRQASSTVNGASKLDNSSFYAILGVPEAASLSDLRAAYRALAVPELTPTESQIELVLWLELHSLYAMSQCSSLRQQAADLPCD